MKTVARGKPLVSRILRNLMAGSTETRTRRPRMLYWVVTLAVAGVLLYLSLRGIQWPRVWSIVRGAQVSVVALGLAIMSFALFVRSLRWRVLLSAHGSVPVPLAFWATSAGYLGNNALPARAGEVIRSLMVSRLSGISKAFALTTTLCERIVDAIALSAISAGVLLTLPTKPGWLSIAARPFAVLASVGAVAIVLLPVFESFWFKLLALLPIPEVLVGRAERMLHEGLKGIGSLHDRGRLGRFLSLTAITWCLEGVTTIVVARAVGLPMNLHVAFLLVAGLGLGSALPSTPGYVGIYQFVAVSVLTPFGLSKAGTIAYIFLFQAMNYLVVVSWSLLGLARHRGPVAVRFGPEIASAPTSR